MAAMANAMALTKKGEKQWRERSRKSRLHILLVIVDVQWELRSSQVLMQTSWLPTTNAGTQNFVK